MDDISKFDIVPVLEYISDGQSQFQILNRKQGLPYGPFEDEELQSLELLSEQFVDLIASIDNKMRQKVDTETEETIRGYVSTVFIQTVP